MNKTSFPEALSRCVKIDQWIFEVKSVRAIRVNEFGQPYSATANITLNGDSAYIDGLLTKEGEDFNREDYQAFVKLTQQLELKSFNFDRFKKQRRVSHTVKVAPIEPLAPELKLVKA
ncbi:hypothetical protein SAMN05216262_101605 [Colwellia chukchiensis]|uniref:Uncharacterized protein n=1 Tax=Colwellia chukchiensis TaxID=641665 RepID=A0A1H7HU17_9GAMM|nr:hypothetical protein [Colwellia chukchiensis]SEK53856.1 hypothetical protein SAMN05216262_101605 [Colwellia chukchiensis]